MQEEHTYLLSAVRCSYSSSSVVEKRTIYAHKLYRSTYVKKIQNKQKNCLKVQETVEVFLLTNVNVALFCCRSVHSPKLPSFPSYSRNKLYCDIIEQTQQLHLIQCVQHNTHDLFLNTTFSRLCEAVIQFIMFLLFLDMTFWSSANTFLQPLQMAWS